MLRRLLAIALIFLAGIVCALPACSSHPAAGGKPVVMCTIFAYYDAARAIADGKLDVRILLPKDNSPHDYEANINDKVSVAQANLYIKNGMGLDDHFDKLLEGSHAKVLNISQKIPDDMLLQTQEISLDNTNADAPAVVNPHIWLDPLIQMKAAEAIRDALIELDPADKAVFEENTKKYLADLEKLDMDFKAAAATFKSKEFIGFHSAYAYLARRYGLRQIASIEELPGSDVTIAQSLKIIQLIKERHIRFIAVETALSGQGAKKIEEETGAKEIVLQPLETYDDPADTYTIYMRRNLEALKTALGGT